MAVVSDNESVQIEIEAILHGRAVNFRDQAARLRKSSSVDTDTVADGNQFLWRLSGMLAASPADMNAEFMTARRQSPLQGSNDTRRNTRGVPVHAHDGTERLKPEGICKAPQQLIPTVVMDDGLRHDCTEPGHPVGQPPWNVPAV